MMPRGTNIESYFECSLTIAGAFSFSATRVPLLWVFGTEPILCLVRSEGGNSLWVF